MLRRNARPFERGLRQQLFLLKLLPCLVEMPVHLNEDCDIIDQNIYLFIASRNARPFERGLRQWTGATHLPKKCRNARPFERGLRQRNTQRKLCFQGRNARPFERGLRHTGKEYWNSVRNVEMPVHLNEDCDKELLNTTAFSSV